MNDFALNAAAINGSVEVWIDAVTAAVELQSSGDVYAGLVGHGTANVVAGLTGDAFALVKLSGDAVVETSAQGVATIWITAEGSAQLVLSATGDGTRWVFGVGSNAITWNAEGDGQVVELLSGRFNIELSASLDGAVGVTQRGEGDALVLLDAGADFVVSKAHFAHAEALIRLGSAGAGYAIVHSPDAYGQFELSAFGDMRLAERVFGSGDSIIQLFARGSLGSIHYEYGEGSAAIEFDTVIERFGRPDLPIDYVPAPAARTFMVQKSSRTLTVQRDNRSL